MGTTEGFAQGITWDAGCSRASPGMGRSWETSQEPHRIAQAVGAGGWTSLVRGWYAMLPGTRNFERISCENFHKNSGCERAYISLIIRSPARNLRHRFGNFLFSSLGNF